YAKDNYMSVGSDGGLEWIANYYDPIVNHMSTAGAAAGVFDGMLLLPQDRELTEFLYEAAANSLGWNDPSVPVQPSPAGTLLAREFGDHTSLERLRAAAELAFEPKSFGDHDEMFGWWFGLNDGFPRGQLSAQMMLAEVGEADAWGRALEAPHLDKYAAPTVEGVDFPSLGLYQAWNDTDGGALNVGTYAAAPDRRGMETSWRVTNLPDPDDVYILCDGLPFSRFAVDGPDSIRIDGDIAQRHYQIFTGYRGESAEQADARRRLQRQAGASATAAGAALADRDRNGRSGTGGRGQARGQQASTTLASEEGPTCACCVA
ncbi:MAG: hypothetical protein OXH04_03905, partial [Acidobacteria bacterium]|nr:hypothetical protein [Acidobacteriota bacterium]